MTRAYREVPPALVAIAAVSPSTTCLLVAIRPSEVRKTPEPTYHVVFSSTTAGAACWIARSTAASGEFPLTRASDAVDDTVPAVFICAERISPIELPAAEAAGGTSIPGSSAYSVNSKCSAFIR